MAPLTAFHAIYFNTMIEATEIRSRGVKLKPKMLEIHDDLDVPLLY